MRYCYGEDSQETFELERARLRRKHANCGVCGQFAEHRCGGCKRIGVDCYYCSVECAKRDRPVHRLVCGQPPWCRLVHTEAVSGQVVCFVASE